MSRMLALACALAAFAIAAGSALAPAFAQQALAQQPAATPPYGPPITLDHAKRAMAAAELEAAKNSWQVAITILDSGGNLVMFHKIDNAQLASIGASEGKARTALRFKRPSKALDDAIAAGGAGLRLLAVKDITPLEGGMPIAGRRQDHRRHRRLRRAVLAGRPSRQGRRRCVGEVTLRTPSPQRGEGWGEGGRTFRPPPPHPTYSLRSQVDLSPQGRGEKQIRSRDAFRARVLRMRRHNDKALLDSPRHA